MVREERKSVSDIVGRIRTESDNVGAVALNDFLCAINGNLCDNEKYFLSLRFETQDILKFRG